MKLRFIVNNIYYLITCYVYISFLSRVKEMTEVTDLLCGQCQSDHNHSTVEPPLLHVDCDDHDGDNPCDDRIVDLVLKGQRVNSHSNYQNYTDHLLSSDEEDILDDSILTDSSGPLHSKDLLRELLYSRDRDESDRSSSVVIPAVAFDSDSTASSEGCPVLKDKEKPTDKIETDQLHLYGVPVSRRPVRGEAVHIGLGKQGEMIEKNILNGIGLDRLTKLGRINAAKVVVSYVSITDLSPSGHGNQAVRNDKYSIIGVLCV